MRTQNNWETIIDSKSDPLSRKFREIWLYRDLLYMFVRKSFVTYYKQTILGPAWFVIQPLLTTTIFVIIFGKVAKISTDGLPQILFYLSGIILWNYFSDCLTTISNTFVSNKGILGKVYFPRLILPLSQVISGLLKLVIQYIIFLFIYCFYLLTTKQINPGILILFTPILVIMMSLLSMGLGMIITSVTTKYRDLIFLLQFGVQLFMYATPIIYPVSQIPERFHSIVFLNPMAIVVECFRFAYLGVGTFKWIYLFQSFAIIMLVFYLGLVLFNKTEKSFMDTI